MFGEGGGTIVTECLQSIVGFVLEAVKAHTGPTRDSLAPVPSPLGGGCLITVHHKRMTDVLPCHVCTAGKFAIPQSANGDGE